MKNLFCLFLLALSMSVHAQVAVTTDNSNPDPSAMLDIKSTNKGLLIPRLDSAQRVAIAGPASGLLVYQADGADGFYFYNGTNWVILSDATQSPKVLADADNNTKIQVEESADEDIIRFDTGGTEYFRMNHGRLEMLNTGSSVYMGSAAGFNDDFNNNRNVGIGHEALYSNTIGFYNFASGYRALYSNTIGTYQTAIGYQALYSNTTGASNTANGYLTLFSNITGSYNTANGFTALLSNTTGYFNTATGYSALFANTTGGANTATGTYALFATTGEENVAMGTYALLTNTTGDFNTGIGYSAEVGSGDLSNATAIGYRARVDQSNSLVLGSIGGVNGATADVNVGIGTTTPGNKLDISSDGVAGIQTIVLGLSSNVSNRPVIQFSEGTDATLTSGMSIEYNGVGAASDNKIHINGIDGLPKLTVENGGQVGIGESSPDRELTVFDTDGNGDAAINVKSNNSADRELLLAVNQSTGGIIGMTTDNDLFFRSNNTNRMVIKNTGDVGIGTSNPTQLLSVNGTAGKPGGGSWASFSDKRMKQDIRPFQQGLAEVISINPVRFRYNKLSGYDTQTEYVGVIAQELQGIAPYMVSTIEKDGEAYLQVDNSAMTYMLINAVKELYDENLQLKKEIALIKSVVEASAQKQ
ncbi:MAG: tail fiber domain-containing protein [Bacteroidota bacterium]